MAERLFIIGDIIKILWGIDWDGQFLVLVKLPVADLRVSQAHPKILKDTILLLLID